MERRYALRVEVCVPDRALLEPFVRAKGLFSFYEDGHAECCELRKVEPLRRQLAGLEGWITGVRRDQSQDTRAAVPVVQVDPFEGEGPSSSSTRSRPAPAPRSGTPSRPSTSPITPCTCAA